MYLTEVYHSENNKDFDWEAYFSGEPPVNIIKQIDPLRMISRVQTHLKENNTRLGLAINRLMKELLKGIEIRTPKVLDLGPAIGFLTRWLLNRYQGSAVLVDKSKESNAGKDNLEPFITYINEDFFQLQTEEAFDLVCSFGLIKHFIDKKAVPEAHKKFVSPRGMIIILIPLDSPLTRAFLEIHPQLNPDCGKLLTEREFKTILTKNGLQVLRTQISQGYCYDFIGALCRKE